MSRRGFTLTEVLMALTMVGILGIAMTRIMINDSRFVSRQDAALSARQGARAALHTALAELQSVDTVFAVSLDSASVGIPFAWGVLCKANTGGVAIVSLLPGDSAAYATGTATVVRVARKNPATSTYYYHTQTRTLTPSTNYSACTSDSVRYTAGQVVSLSAALTTGPAASPGDIVYLYQKITFLFANSTDPSLSGRRALFRRDQNGTLDELVAPFDTSAKFRCLTGPDLARQSCSGITDLGTIRGLELKLVTASDNKPQGMSKYQTFDLSTRVVFLNNLP